MAQFDQVFVLCCAFYHDISDISTYFSAFSAARDGPHPMRRFSFANHSRSTKFRYARATGWIFAPQFSGDIAFWCSYLSLPGTHWRCRTDGMSG